MLKLLIVLFKLVIFLFRISILLIFVTAIGWILLIVALLLWDKYYMQTADELCSTFWERELTSNKIIFKNKQL